MKKGKEQLEKGKETVSKDLNNGLNAELLKEVKEIKNLLYTVVSKLDRIEHNTSE